MKTPEARRATVPAEDEELPVVEVGGLLDLLHHGEVECEAHQQEDPHHKEEDCCSKVEELDHTKVSHFD